MSRILYVVAMILSAVMLWREISVRNKFAVLNKDMSELRQSVRDIRRQMSSSQCISSDPEPVLSEEARPTSNSFTSTPAFPKLYDFNAVMLLGLYVLCIYLEVYYLHAPFFDELETSATVIPPKYQALIRLFLSNRLPGVNFIVFAIIYTGSVFAWIGLLNRDSLAHAGTKMLLLFSTAMPLGLVVNNLAAIWRYLPSSIETWAIKFKDVSFWWWVFTKALALDNADHIVQGLINIIVSLTLSLPFRYLFYYRQRGFFAEPDSVNLFVINMLIHASFAWLWLHTLTILLIGTPNIARTNKILKYLSQNSTFVIGFSICQVINVLIFFLRLMWFIFVSWACETWTSVFAVLTLGLTYITLVFVGTPLFSLYMQRLVVQNEEKSSFSENFVDKANQTSTEMKGDQNELKKTATDLFEFILDRSTILASVLTQEELAAYTASAAPSGQEEAFGSIMKTIFKQTAYHVVEWLNAEAKNSDATTANSFGLD